MPDTPLTTTARSGVLLVVCAPSGTGKTTLIQRLRAEFPNFAYSISCTTRAPRSHEVDGKDYHFLSVEEFLRRREAGFLRNGPMCTAIITGRRWPPCSKP